MSGIFDARCHIRRISPNDGYHYFYGYYDNPGFSPDGEWHLCHRASFSDHIPLPGETCELGVVHIKSGTFEPFARTRAWNLQQGTMLQYLDADTVIYNVEEDSAYRATIHNLKTGAKRMLDRAVANVSRDKRWALGINMSRLFDFRPGYGYATLPDPYADIAAPEEDGAFCVDMQTGKSHLVLSYRQMVELFIDSDPQIANEKLVINHITFNPRADRFFFQVRNMPRKPGIIHDTGVATIGRNGEEFHKMTEFSPHASHYNWRDNTHVLMYAQCHRSNDVRSMLLLTDQSDEIHVYPTDVFDRDIHCIYAPNGRYVAGDTMDNQGYRCIYLFDMETYAQVVLFRAFSAPYAIGDYRCDLHNRWSPDGKRISFDSTHDGPRGLFVADVFC